MAKRPQNNKELQKREAIGVIRASRFVRRYAHSDKPITIQIFCEIHKEIFKHAWVEVAGKYRKESIKITGSKHLPPHFSKVPGLMKEAGAELERRLAKLAKIKGIILDEDEEIDKVANAIKSVIFIAA